jgi:anti-anti-sigma regulatory factor
MTAMSLELRTAGTGPGPGMTVAGLRGDVDGANAAELEAALTDLAGPALIVDLSEAGYFDSAGFAVLDRLLARLSLAVVISPDSVLRAAAELMGVPFHDTVDQARASLRAAP